MISKEVLEFFINQGLSSYKIADKCNTTRAIIQYWMDKYDLKTTHKPKNKTVDYEVKFLCKDCGESDHTLFYPTKRQKCKKCCISDRRYRATKQLIVEYLGGKCENCGYCKCLAALSLHHIDPSIKNKNYRKFIHADFERAKRLVEGCKLLCMNCHFELHWMK